jgi:hypothetical protein
MRALETDIGINLDRIAIGHRSADSPHVDRLIFERADDGRDLII